MGSRKEFRFDAIGRDLFPAEKLAAKVFIHSHTTPQDEAKVKQQMRRVRALVKKAALAGRPFTSRFYDLVAKEASCGS